jgi:DNA-binding transcriptional regulator YiaG
MPRLAALLRDEIRRLAAREVRKSSVHVRRLRLRMAGLKQTLRTQKRALARLERRVESLKRRSGSGPGAPAERSSISSTRVAALRDRLQMTRLEFADLLGVSPGSIFGWEKGRTVPRGANAARVLEVERGGRPAARQQQRRRRRMRAARRPMKRR